MVSVSQSPNSIHIMFTCQGRCSLWITWPANQASANHAVCFAIDLVPLLFMVCSCDQTKRPAARTKYPIIPILIRTKSTTFPCFSISNSSIPRLTFLLWLAACQVIYNSHLPYYVKWILPPQGHSSSSHLHCNFLPLWCFFLSAWEGVHVLLLTQPYVTLNSGPCIPLDYAVDCLTSGPCILLDSTVDCPQ